MLFPWSPRWRTTGHPLWTRVRMPTGRVRFGWSVWAPKTETRTWNPNPTRTPIRVQIQTQNRNPQIPETERIIRNPNFFQTSNASQQHHFQVSNKHGQLKCKTNKQSNKHDSNYIPARHSAVRLLQIVEIITNKVAPHREHSKVQMFNTSETIEINIHGSPNK